MKIWLLAAIGALLIGGLPTAAILLASDDTSAGTVHPGRTAHAKPWKQDGPGPGRGHAFGLHKHGQGTPGQRHQRLRQWQRQWLQQRQSLTPQQRAKRMSELARRHAAALDKWATCLQQKHDPQSCPRPVPPGIAKKLSPPRQQG